MKWRIKKVETTEVDKLQKALDNGWEPFAVTTFQATQHLTYEYVWLRKST